MKKKLTKLILTASFLIPFFTLSNDALAASWSEMPSPTTLDLRSVWGSSGTDVYTVGNYGKILHYDGNSSGTWTTIESETTEQLDGVWGSSETDVFVVGDGGTILHYDGDTWISIDSGTTNHLRSVCGNSGSDVFAVGKGGSILHYDGTNWTSMESGTGNPLRDVWGNSENDVFAVGYNCTILHYNGTNWTPMQSGKSDNFTGVWGSSGTDVFAVGASGTILYYDGDGDDNGVPDDIWEPMTSGTSEWIIDVWGTSGTDVFAVGFGGIILHYDGNLDGIWEIMLSGDPFNYNHYAVWGSSGIDVFSVTLSGHIMHYTCDINADCDDGIFCNGAETCVDDTCQPGTYPCSDPTPLCNEVIGCYRCSEDGDCDDDEDCTIDVCNTGVCEYTNNDAAESTTCGLGACEHTIATCVGGVLQVCDPMEGASAELCDGLDNDCDGATDEFTVTLTPLGLGNPGDYGVLTATVNEDTIGTVGGMEVTFGVMGSAPSITIELSPMAELDSSNQAVANILGAENGSGELSFTVVDVNGDDLGASCIPDDPSDSCATITATTPGYSYTLDIDTATLTCETEMTVTCDTAGYLITSFDTSEPITVTFPSVTDPSGVARALVEAKKEGTATVAASVGCGTDGEAQVAITQCDDDEDCNFLDDPCNEGACDLDDPSSDTYKNCYKEPLPDGTPCNDNLFCTGNDACNDSGVCIGSGNPCPPGSTCNEVLNICESLQYYRVYLSPSTATLDSGDTIPFSAVTKRNGVNVAGSYVYEIVEDGDIESRINHFTGIYTAGVNNTGSDVTETIKVTDTDHDVTDTARVTVRAGGCEVVISPASAEVPSNETEQFEALTTCNGEEVAGTYQWEVISTIIESTINATTGLYTAGINNTDSGVIDTIQVTDTDNGVTHTAEVTVLPRGPVVCDITITPSVSIIDSGESVTFTALIEEEGCLTPDFSWEIDTDPEVNSQIDPDGATCLYTAGSNKTDMLKTDTITVIDSANGTEAEISVDVLYGRILGVFPNLYLSSRWTPLAYIVFIIGEDTGFNDTSYPTFTPDDSITTIGQIGIGDLMGVLIFLSSNAESSSVDLAVTTINGEEQEVTFTKENAFQIDLLPLILDEEEPR